MESENLDVPDIIEGKVSKEVFVPILDRSSSNSSQSSDERTSRFLFDNYSTDEKDPNTPESKIINENGDPSFLLASHCLDFFVKRMGGKDYGPRGKNFLDAEDPDLWAQLDKMWLEAPLLCLKLIFYKGDCRGGSKEKRLWLVCFNWLMHAHPTVAWKCLPLIPTFRYWKDLVNVIAIRPEGGDLFRSWTKEVATIFSKQLQKDLALLKSPEVGKGISLSAKWTPSEKSAGQKRSGRLLNLIRNYFGMTAQRFRKEVLSPLRTHIKVVEQFMCAREWERINYSHVPSVAMHTYRKAFEKHDQAGFNKWLRQLKAGEKGVKVQVSQLFPHTVAEKYLRNGDYDELTEQQWKALVDSTVKSGSFNRSLVIADTSSSMTGIPMNVAISLGILITNSIKGIFHNKIINFSTEPSFHTLSGSSLHDDVQILKRVPWGGSTDLDKVFEMILKRAEEEKVSNDDMPSRLFILTDMQFNYVGSKNGALERAEKSFKNKGYSMPEVICWNLGSDISTVASGDHTPGVSMISGFSQDILKVILRGGFPSPYQTMISAIEDPRYDCFNSIIKESQ